MLSANYFHAIGGGKFWPSAFFLFNFYFKKSGLFLFLSRDMRMPFVLPELRKRSTDKDVVLIGFETGCASGSEKAAWDEKVFLRVTGAAVRTVGKGLCKEVVRGEGDFLLR